VGLKKINSDSENENYLEKPHSSGIQYHGDLIISSCGRGRGVLCYHTVVTEISL